MIAKANIMNVLLKASPSFAWQWQAFQDEWRNQAHELPLYLVLADFARHIIKMVGRGRTEQLIAVFSAIEQLHKEGDSEVREMATIGLLESLQNTNLHAHGTDPEQFRSYLGPDSMIWWDKLDRFWEHGELLTED